jgi:HAD superfamily hydrolase (TIGR01509 family)
MIPACRAGLIGWDLTAPARAILFDFDGTLVDSEPLHYEAWMHAVRAFGARTDWGDYRARFVGQTDTWAGRTFLASVGHQADEETVRSVCLAKHAYYRAKTPERLRIADSVRDFIREALCELSLGIVSSSPTIDVEPTVERAGLGESFEVYVCGEHVRNHKPDPEPYHSALERLNAQGRALRAVEVVVFEDSPSGIAAARAAGMRVRAVDDPRNLVELARAELGL